MLVALGMAAMIGFPFPIVVDQAPVGMRPSAYEGRYFNPADEEYRKCVAQLEARHNYGATGSNGKYVGTYQFTRDLARGAVWMMAKEWRQEYGKATADAMRDTLHATDPTRWSRRVWDQAFWTVLNWDGVGSGERHWAAQRGRCWLGMISYGGPR